MEPRRAFRGRPARPNAVTDGDRQPRPGRCAPTPRAPRNLCGPRPRRRADAGEARGPHRAARVGARQPGRPAGRAQLRTLLGQRPEPAAQRRERDPARRPAPPGPPGQPGPPAQGRPRKPSHPGPSPTTGPSRSATPTKCATAWPHCSAAGSAAAAERRTGHRGRTVRARPGHHRTTNHTGGGRSMTAPHGFSRSTQRPGSGSGELNWLLDELVDRVGSIRKALVLSSDGLATGTSRDLTREDGEHLAAVASGFHSLAKGVGRHFEAGRRPPDRRRTRRRLPLRDGRRRRQLPGRAVRRRLRRRSGRVRDDTDGQAGRRPSDHRTTDRPAHRRVSGVRHERGTR